MRRDTLDDHPNLMLLGRVSLPDIARSADVFADDVVFHYFNPAMPDLQGDYVGLDGLRAFFARIANLSEGTFDVRPVSATGSGMSLS